MSGQRAAARIARRELRRRPVTTLLVALLVAIPVAAMVVGVVAVRTGPVPEDVADQQAVGNGQASVSILQPQAADVMARIRSVSPDARIVPVSVAAGYLRTPEGQDRSAEVSSGDFADPVIRDRYVVDGRMPSAPGELAVSSAFADHWGVVPGDDLAIDEIDLAGPVVGIADTTEQRNQLRIYATTFPDLEPTTVTEQLFIADPDGLDAETAAALGALSGQGAVIFNSDRIGMPGVSLGASTRPLQPPGATELAVASAWGGGALALAVMAIVISSAFAIGARRQLRTLGLLAANGAPPGVVRGAVSWQGFWVGGAGTALGLVLGAGGLAALWPFRSSFLPYEPTGWVWEPRDVVPIVLLGVTAPVVAAALPARSAGRLSVLQALAGRRPLAPVRRRVVVGGLLSAALGLGLLAGATVGAEWKPWRQGVWTTVGVVGGLAVLLGAVAAAPVAVGAAGRLGGRGHGTAKLALRNLGRQRARSSAVVAGIVAAGALCVGVSAATASTQRQTGDNQLHLATDVASVSAWSRVDDGPAPASIESPNGSGWMSASTYQPTFAPTPPAMLDEIQAAVPDAQRIDTPVLRAGVVGFDFNDPDLARYMSSRSPRAAPATPELVEAMGVPDDARAALDRGEAVALGAPASVRRMSLSGYLGGPANDTGTIDVTPFPDADGWFGLPSVLVPPPLTDQAGFTTAPTWDAAHLFVSPDPITDDEWAAIRAINGHGVGPSFRFRLAGEPPPTSTRRWPEVELVAWAPPPSWDASKPLLWTSAGTLVFTTMVVALGLALAARDTRDEREVLEAVGAPPALLRRLAGTRAALLAVLGVVIAVPTGLLPVWVVLRTSRPALPVAVPWPSLAAVLVVIPAVIGAGALLGSALTSRFRPATASGFAAD